MDAGYPFSSVARRRVVIVAAVLVACVASPAALGQEHTGKEVVAAQCVSCHGSGAKGAPRIGDKEAWAKRASQGLTSLTGTALDGIRQMPPHGGNPALTDTEIERAIVYMVNQSGGHWTEPISRTARPVDRSGGQIVQDRCVNCHGTGEGGAPKIGDRAAWIPRLRQGLDIVVSSAIKGHGGMPARGGQADLTDVELRNAIVYMMNPVIMVYGKRPQAAGRQDYRVVDGTTVYFGAVSADAIRRNRNEYPENVYGASPVGPDQYYLTIALFDVNSGKRVPDAAVRARVSTAAAAGPEKMLEPLKLAESSTYGNYFAMGGAGPFEITVTFRRPGAPDTSQARFQYARQ